MEIAHIHIELDIDPPLLYLGRMCDVLKTLDVPYLIGGSLASAVHGVVRATMLLCLLLLLVCPTLASSGPLEKGYAPGELIVKLGAPGQAKLSLTARRRWDELARQFGVEEPLPTLPSVGRGGSGKVIATDDLSSIYTLRLGPRATVEGAVAAYSSEPFVEYAQPNYLNRHAIAPDDPLYKEQWGLEKIRWEDARADAGASREILIAIVDSGIEYTHPDLSENIWINAAEWDGVPGVDDDANGYVDDVRGWDFTDAPTLPGTGDYLIRDNDPMDESGHGTHVAGIVGAAADNGIGVAGVFPHGKLMALRAGLNLSFGSLLEDDDVAAAIVYAADNRADVINMSWGDPRMSPLIRDVIQYAYGRGCVLVAAAGNERTEGLFFPAGLDETLAVGASDASDQFAHFSNFGWNLDLLAPGVGVISTYLSGQYKTLSGTSMAAPHVAGLAGLILSHHPDFSPEEVRWRLVSSGEELYEPGWDPRSGYGRIDAVRALAEEAPHSVRILEPHTGGGTDSTLVVIGTAAGADILGYELSWGQGTAPGRWYPISRRDASFTLRDTLGVWDASERSDGRYVLRLVARRRDGSEIEDRVIVYADHTRPRIRNVRIEERLDGPEIARFAEWETDDPTTGWVTLRAVGSAEDMGPVDTEYRGREHCVRISDVRMAGTYALRIFVQNASGLTTIADSTIVLRSEPVPETGYSEVAVLPDGYLLPRFTDFDHDGAKEIVLMPYGGDRYNAVAFYEAQEESLAKVFETGNLFIPWNTGDLDEDGRRELMGVDAARVRLFETRDIYSFPSVKIWEAKDAWGGEIADLDGDGRQEIIARSDSENALLVFEAAGNNLLSQVAALPNPTRGNNRLAPRSAVGDFDMDGLNEVIAGDGDGEIFAYEATGNDSFRPTWTGGMTGAQADLLAGAGDLDGDGRPEFAVGYSVTDPFDPRGARWIVAVYQATADDTYKIEWRTEILLVDRSGSGLSFGDFDGDGTDELIVCTVPDLYVFGAARADRYVPLWHTSISATHLPPVGDLDSDGLPEIAFNRDGAVRIYEKDPPSDAPESPTHVTATPVDAATVELRWSGSAERYRLYRGAAPNALERIADRIDGTLYRDEHLIAEMTYFYAITAFDPDATPQESVRSTVRHATPSVPPRLLRAEGLSLRHVAAFFDDPLGPSAKDPSHYRITGGVGTPSSAILDQDDRRVVLGLARDLTPEQEYALVVQGVQDTCRVLISDEADSARFVATETGSSVQIVSVQVLSPVEIEVAFSDPIDPSSNAPSMYALSRGARVTSVSTDSLTPRIVRLTLDDRAPLKAMGYPYELVVEGVLDDLGRPVSDRALLRLAAEELSSVWVFPNPTHLRGEAVRFGGLTARAIVQIYTIEGVLVRTLTETDGDGGLRWDGRNERGEAIGPGIYFYRIEDERAYTEGKFAVIR